MNVADFELDDPRSALPRRAGAVKVLVRFRGEVLGEVTLPTADESPDAIHRRLLEPFRGQTAARDLVSTHTSTKLSADEVAVVVCTRDRPHLLAGCLSALAALDPVPAEVVVVDNAPSDGATAAVVERFGFRRIVEARPGLSFARNAGWRATCSPIVAFTDDDARPHTAWAGHIASAFDVPGVECATGLVVAGELRTIAQRWFEHNGGMQKGYAPRLFSRDIGVRSHLVGVGANMAFLRRTLERIGGFDPRLGPGRATRGGDDLDAIARSVHDGGAALYEPDAVVRHLHRSGLISLAQQYRDNGVGYSSLLAKFETERGEFCDDARSERRRWRFRRHVVGMLDAVRRGDAPALFELVNEHRGARLGSLALKDETRAIAELIGCSPDRSTF